MIVLATGETTIAANLQIINNIITKVKTEVNKTEKTSNNCPIKSL
jgi:hypothetical protein